LWEANDEVKGTTVYFQKEMVDGSMGGDKVRCIGKAWIDAKGQGMGEQ
jgi:hypothetical protein